MCGFNYMLLYVRLNCKILQECQNLPFIPLPTVTGKKSKPQMDIQHTPVSISVEIIYFAMYASWFL